MKTFIQIIFAIVLTACDSSSSQIRKSTKSELVSESEREKLADYFTPFTNWTFKDSIKVNFDVTKSADYKNVIDISFFMPTDTIKTKINRQGGMLNSDDNIFIDVNKNIAFILWISEPFYNPQGTDPRHSFDLYLKSVNLYNGRENFEKNIYSSKCCIDRLSMIYNPFTSSVLISYNDFSRSDGKYLMYGFIKIDESNFPSNNFEPVEIIDQDKSEKRYPHFINNGKCIFLYHSSGDRWGFFEHTEKAQIGISNIDNSNTPIDYRIILDSFEIETKLFLNNDTLFYRVRIENENQPDKMQIKKTTINDLDKY